MHLLTTAVWRLLYGACTLLLVGVPSAAVAVLFQFVHTCRVLLAVVRDTKHSLWLRLSAVFIVFIAWWLPLLLLSVVALLLALCKGLTESPLHGAWSATDLFHFVHSNWQTEVVALWALRRAEMAVPVDIC